MSLTRNWSCLLTVVILACWSGDILTARPQQQWVARFSEELPGKLPSHWKNWSFSKNNHTDYRLQTVDGQTVLAANSTASASAVVRQVNVDPRRFPILRWSWSTTAEALSQTDDFPTRLFVIFEPRKKGLWSSLSGAMKKLGGGFNGKAINYVWSDSDPEGTMRFSPVTRQVKMISVEAGESNVGTWVREQRNVYEDYLEAFGEKPGRIVAIALMTDTDNGGGQATSFYGDILFSSGE